MAIMSSPVDRPFLFRAARNVAAAAWGAPALAAPLLVAGLLAAPSVNALPLAAQAQDVGSPPAELERWESRHAIEVGGETVEYDAVVGGVVLTNGEGEAADELYYTAYFRTNGAPPADRPLVFAYNGGPVSASLWLHMGIMGPRRVDTPEAGPQGAPPYPLEDNA